MTFTISQFKDGFLIPQVKLVNAIQEDWKPRPFLQTVKNYRQTLQGESFDPELNLYGFDSDELVVVINSQIRGDVLRIQPFSKQNHTEQLYQIFENLKERLRKKYPDIDEIETVGGSGWKDRMTIIRDLSFSRGQPLFVSSTSSVTSLHDASHDDVNVELVDYDDEKHFDDLFELFNSKFNLPSNRIRTELKEMYKLRSITISWKVALREDRVVGHGLLLLDKPNHNYAFLREILIENEGNRNLFRYIYSAIIQDLFNFNRKLTSLTLRVSMKDETYISYFEELGYDFNHYYSYKLPLR